MTAWPDHSLTRTAGRGDADRTGLEGRFGVNRESTDRESTVDPDPCPLYARRMRAVEFTVELKGEAVVSIPEEVVAELPKTGHARVIILTGDDRDDALWHRTVYEQFLRDDAPEDAIYDTYK